MIVDVTDVNEPPVFLSTHFAAAVSEGVGVGTVLFSGLLAVDLDQVQKGLFV